MKKYVNRCIKYILIFTVILFILQYNGFSTTKESAGEIKIKGIRAKVTEVISESKDSQLLELIIIEGDYINHKLKAEFYPVFNFYGITLSENDEVFLNITIDENKVLKNVTVTNVARDRYMLYLFAGYVLLLFIIGGFKGLRAVISLILSYLIIIKLLFPLIIKGYTPVYATVLICSIITVFTLVLIGGFNRKTLSAILGTFCGLVIAAVLAVKVGDMAHITGVIDDEFYLLKYLPLNSSFSYQGLLFSGMIISSLGAVMDVSMSISSSINELKEHSYNLNTLKLISAGMNVGRDAIGTMTNTLILAYIGGSIYMMLIIIAEDVSLIHFINSEAVATEILRSMAGSIGIIVTVPVTAIISGLLI
ncbi:YibE/F family protein [Sedimentibacter sp.]|uniref:YibE/F family protein n=1 Tax=Sedimentibacter sp. TaxID=1960295 RepID=UPI0028A105F9|nr:YibE/F family protein [Sedimentibacter sp.]